MTNIRYFIFADYATVDQSGKLTVSGFFDTFQMTVIPSNAPKFFLVIGFQGITDDAKLYVNVYDPDGNQVGQITGEVSSPGGADVANMIVNLDEFPIPKRGKYIVEVKDADCTLGTYDFKVDWIPSRIFEPGEIDRILTDPTLAKGAHIKVMCPKCGQEKKYQLSIDPDKKLSEGFEWFPEDNILRCCSPETNVDMTGIRRQIEWGFGQKLPDKAE